MLHRRQQSSAQGARVLVVGSARKNRAERIVLGTTSMSVVAHAPCPVVLVPENASTKGDGRVVVGIDGSAHSRLAFDHALDAAALRGRTVTTVTSWNVEVEGGVVVTEPGTPEWEAVDSRYRRMAESTIEAARRAHPEIEVTVEVRHGRAADSLVEVAEGADLLLVGSRGRGGFRGMLLGSVTQRVLALAIDHANARVQFGKPVGRQQAVQHMLAVMAEQVVAVRLMVEQACAVPNLASCAAAKAVASAAAADMAEAAHAVIGAIGEVTMWAFGRDEALVTFEGADGDIDLLGSVVRSL